MKIAIILDSLSRAGAERQGLYLVRGLASRGHSVELIYYHRVAHEYDLNALGDAKITFLAKNGTYLRFLLRMRRHLKRGRYDVVHAFKSSPSIYASFAGRFAKRPVVLGGYRNEYRQRGFKRHVHRVVSRLLDGWIVNSQAIVDSLVDCIGAKRERCAVVYNGIEPEKFVSELTRTEAKRKLGLSPDDPVVAKIARLKDQKNHALFLDAIAHILKTAPNAHFLIVGRGPLQPQLEAQAARLGIDHCVHFLGNRPDVPDLLAATDVSVLTSHYEGLSNVLLESMVVGIPIVSTDYLGADELIHDGHNGFLVPCGDAHAVAERISTLIQDGDLRKRIGANGRKTVMERFTIEAMATAALATYEKHLARLGRAVTDSI